MTALSAERHGAQADRRVLGAVRRLCVGAASVMVLAAAVAYVLLPPVEPFAVGVVIAGATPIGKEAIRGVVLEDGKPATNTTLTVYRRRGGHLTRLKSTYVHAHGRFVFHERPGSYSLLVRHAGHSTRIAITLGRGKTVYVNIVIRLSGGFLIGPIIFNY